MTTGLFELAIIVLLASGLGILAQMFRQPTIVAAISNGIDMNGAIAKVVR